MKNKIFLPVIIVLSAICLLTGCATVGDKDGSKLAQDPSVEAPLVKLEAVPVQEGVETVVETQNLASLPAPVALAQIVDEKQTLKRNEEEKPKPLTISQIMDEKRAPVELFSFSAKGADIRDVLLAISKESKMNIIVDPEIKGEVTVDLKDVTLEQALNQLLPQYGLDYKKEGNFVRVFKPKLEMQTRVFIVNYLATKRIGSRTITASTGATNMTGGMGGMGGGMGGGGMGSMGSTLMDSDSADIWGDIQDSLEAIIFGKPEYVTKSETLPNIGGMGGSMGGGSGQLQTRITSRGGLIDEKSDSGKRLLINKISSTIMVTDYPANLNKIAEFLEVLEGTAHRQVVIRAKIVEVTLSDEYQMGIDWEFIQNEIRLKDFTLPFTASHFGKPTGSFKFGKETSGTTGAAAVASTSIAFSDVIDALSKQGKIRVLSSPRIATLNNQKAIIKVARQDVFFTQLGVGGGLTGGGGAPSIIPATVDIGIILDVLPQIGSDGTLTMSIHPSISEKVGDAISPVGDGKTTFPIIDIRETDTTVRMADGQTAIIGGLMRESTNKQETGIPGLKSIPLLGKLFSHTAITKKNAELVIMLTPTILVGKTVDELSGEERERLQL